MSLEKNLLLCSSDFELNVSMDNKMKILIIDATGKKILLGLIFNKNIYTSTYINSKNNYDKLIILIDKFLSKYKMSLNSLTKIYVNRGPGSYAGIRNSLSIVKAIHLSKKIDYFSFSFTDFFGQKNKYISLDTSYKISNFKNLPNLCDKFNIKKNLIKPLY